VVARRLPAYEDLQRVVSITSLDVSTTPGSEGPAARKLDSGR
jgi:hypothetical protein